MIGLRAFTQAWVTYRLRTFAIGSGIDPDGLAPGQELLGTWSFRSRDFTTVSVVNLPGFLLPPG